MVVEQPFTNHPFFLNEVILNNILAAVQRDPGRRVLVTVDCRRRHRLEKQLRRAPGIDLVFYQHL